MRPDRRNIDTKVRLAEDFYSTPLKIRFRILLKDYICRLKDKMQKITSIIEIRRQAYLCEICVKEFSV
jgi:hypothetical protein